MRLGPDRRAPGQRSGTPPAAALTFLLAAPAINPVVLVSTAVAFPERGPAGVRTLPGLVPGGHRRGVVVGPMEATTSLLHDGRAATTDHGGGRLAVASSTWPAKDLVHAGGYLVVGAMAAATLQLIIPRSGAGTRWLTTSSSRS